MTTRSTPLISSEMLAPASAVPVIEAGSSLALTRSSPVTLEISGTFGATVSTVMVRVPAAEVLPAASVAVTDRVSGPSPMAAMSAAVSL